MITQSIIEEQHFHNQLPFNQEQFAVADFPTHTSLDNRISYLSAGVFEKNSSPFKPIISPNLPLESRLSVKRKSRSSHTLNPLPSKHPLLLRNKESYQRKGYKFFSGLNTEMSSDDDSDSTVVSSSLSTSESTQNLDYPPHHLELYNLYKFLLNKGVKLKPQTKYPPTFLLSQIKKQFKKRITWEVRLFLLTCMSFLYNSIDENLARIFADKCLKELQAWLRRNKADAILTFEKSFNFVKSPYTPFHRLLFAFLCIHKYVKQTGSTNYLDTALEICNQVETFELTNDAVGKKMKKIIGQIRLEAYYAQQLRSIKIIGEKYPEQAFKLIQFAEQYRSNLISSLPFFPIIDLKALEKQYKNGTEEEEGLFSFFYKNVTPYIPQWNVPSLFARNLSKG